LHRLSSLLVPLATLTVFLFTNLSAVKQPSAPAFVEQAFNGAVGPRTALRIFVYDLRYEYSLEAFLKSLKEEKTNPKSNCDWNMDVCEEQWTGLYSMLRQCGGDAILIQKFRRYPRRVYDPDDADLFVVPYPHSSFCRFLVNPKWNGCKGKHHQRQVSGMLDSLQHFNNATRKLHLFLLCCDTPHHQRALLEMPLYVSLGGQEFRGSTNIVIPPPNTEPHYQPSALAKFDWVKPRTIAVFVQLSLMNAIRRNAFELLNKTKSIAGLPVEVHEIRGRRQFTMSAKKTWEKYRSSYFCPILEGDMPFQKRFFDVVLSGCLPVVVAFPAAGGNPHHSWFKNNTLGYNFTHPFSSMIRYSEFVVQIDDLGDIVSTLHQLLKDPVTIRRMQTALGKVVSKFSYGLGRDFMAPGDAFDTLLLSLEDYVKHLKH